MGYQELKKPKFYIDMMSYLHAAGKTEYFKNEELYDTDLDGHTYSGTFEDLLYLNPISIIKTFNVGNIVPSVQFKSDKSFPTIPVDFIGLLNHNLSNQITWIQSDISVLGASPYMFDKNINFGDASQTIEHNGFSLATFTQTHLLNPEIITIVSWRDANDSRNYIGSFLMGCTWSPPHNPQLKASILRKFDGIKSKKTQAGHTRSDMNYIGNPLWSGRNPFEQWNYDDNFVPDDSNMIIEDSKTNLGETGRRSWKLTWDYVSETNLFAELEQSSDTLNILADSSIDNPFLESDSFISRVWTPTLGGSLPFMLQIDDSNMNPDQFVIARFKKHSLTLTSKAPNLYSFSVDIEETW